ncbi:MarR family winged helix-turn-helix transcriptional regulator [Streptacidiphilus cavernicola]|uniref:MarR family winged helix-turn-helix transcriptional regulator n=1 Tax=Streptacidiphilus cavernicola TaxID=3342716 RepID=A0ABV6W531_9ACTN
MPTAEQHSQEPQWLTAPQLRAWRELTFLMGQLPSVLEAQLKRDAGLSYLEYYVMAGLTEQPNHEMRLSDLANRSNAELSRLSHLISRLERRGFVQRMTDAGDGRYTKAVMTEAGLAHMAEAAPAHVAEVRGLVFDVLDDAEIEVLRSCAEKVNKHLR